ncbi:MAG TPA: MerR family transcriptional regulator [Holophaga sp.]|nr:MerR family transcriptional regulator [Holophaga sp.]
MTERVWLKIGEAAAAIGASPKELRYWERVIPELRPRRSSGNLRYYHVDELPRLRRVREWITEGLTVADCRVLFTTGQLTRPLLGLEEAEAPAGIAAPMDALPAEAPPPKRRRPAMHRVAATATASDVQAERPRHPELAPVIKALRSLAARLSQPPRAASPASSPAFILDPNEVQS